MPEAPRGLARHRVLERRGVAGDLVGRVGRVVGGRLAHRPAPGGITGARVGRVCLGVGARAEDLGQSCRPQPHELAGLCPGAVERGHLEGTGRDHPVLGLGVPERCHRDAQGVLERAAGDVVVPQVTGDHVGRSTHHGEAVLVGDLAVVGEPVELVVVRDVTDLGDEDLHLVGLLAARGEDRAECLGVGVGQAAAGHVAAVVGVAAHVGEAYAGDAEVLELVVAPDRREGDPVVDLADLVEGLGGVLGDEQDAVGVLDRDDGTTAGDALAGEVGPVLHQLLGRDVERHAHVTRLLRRRQVRGAAGPSGRCIREAMIRSAMTETSESGILRPPSGVITWTTGKIRRVRSGPPVAESSSAAS